MIEDYFLQIEHIIREFANIRSLSLKKKIYNAGQGCIIFFYPFYIKTYKNT